MSLWPPRGYFEHPKALEPPQRRALEFEVRRLIGGTSIDIDKLTDAELYGIRDRHRNNVVSFPDR